MYIKVNIYSGHKYQQTINRRGFSKLIKGIYRPRATILLDVEGLNTLFWKMEMSLGCLFLPFLLTIILEILASATRPENEREAIHIWK